MKLVFGVVAVSFLVASTVALAVALDVFRFGNPLGDWLRPQPILTLAGVLLGFIGLWFQLGVQHRNTLKAGAERDRNALKLEIYRDLAATSEDALRAIFALAKLSISADAAWAVGLTEAPSSVDFREAWSKCSTSVIAVMARLEKWEIALGPGHDTFRRAFSRGLDNLSTAVSGLLSTMATPGASTPSLRAAGSALDAATAELMAALKDLRVETQNALLGGLFSYRIPRRKPTDPRIKVATFD